MSALPPEVLRYFVAEKHASIVCLAAAMVSLAAAFLSWRSSYRGAAWPLLAVGLVQLVVGGTILLRTDAQVQDLGRRLAADTPRARAEETARMSRVMASFRVYKVVEMAILTAGLALWMVFPRGAAVHWAGVGCVAEASVMLVFDLAAARRGVDYLEALGRLA